jgi:hypothetical protein
MPQYADSHNGRIGGPVRSYRRPVAVHHTVTGIYGGFPHTRRTNKNSQAISKLSSYGDLAAGSNLDRMRYELAHDLRGHSRGDT